MIFCSSQQPVSHQTFTHQILGGLSFCMAPCIRACLGCILLFPVWASKTTHKHDQVVRFDAICQRAPVHTKIHQLAYNMFFDSLPPDGSVYCSLLEIYSKRWCNKFYDVSASQYLTCSCLSNLEAVRPLCAVWGSSCECAVAGQWVAFD